MTTEKGSVERDRVYCEKSQIEIYRDLTGLADSGRKSVRGPELPPFKSLKDAFLMAVCLGVKIGKKTPLKQRYELANVSTFNNQPDRAVLSGIAIADTGQVAILADQNEILTIAEEYANTGFEELRHAVWGAPLPLQNLVRLLLEDYEHHYPGASRNANHHNSAENVNI